MRFDGTRLLPARRPEVWSALNDTEVLRASVPGCERLVSIGSDQFETVIVASVGPVRMRLGGTLSLVDVVISESYVLKFDLQGGAGFGRGEVRVRLQDESSGSSLHYIADAKVGGRLAQLGSRLIEGTAKKLSESFFERFAAEMADRTMSGKL